MRLAALLLACCSLAAVAAEPQLPELKLTYSAAWKGIGLGVATITLVPEGRKNCYRYESTSNPIGLVRMFVGTPHETSLFCVSRGKVVPMHFEYVNPKSSDKSFTLDFDMKAGKVTDNRGQVREVPPNAQDHFAVQQAVRLWLLKVMDKDDAGTVQFGSVEQNEINQYTFAITGRDEEVETPAGKFKTLRVERVDNPHRKSIFWLAEERAWMPVKVEQSRQDTKDFEMVLKSP
jgi:hypothetical protein